MKLTAEWTDDCQGKKDYDGNILSISTRYWPANGGFHIFDRDHPELGFRPNEIMGKPSAKSSLVINYGEEDYFTLAKAEFEADTEEAVKAAVEEWAQGQMDKAVAVLTAAFGASAPPPDHPQEEG